MLFIGNEFKERMELLGLDVQKLSEESFVDEDDINKIIYNESSFEEIDTFDLDLLCSVLHCKVEYFVNEDIRKKDLLLGSLNRGNDDKHSKEVKAKIQDFINDFQFIKGIS